jgi:hypothetical protein
MSAECDQLPESKSAIMTLWSSQAEQMSRLLDHTTDRKVLQPAMLMLSQLKWDITSMIAETSEAWFTGLPNDARIQNVIESDFSKLQRRFDRL